MKSIHRFLYFTLIALLPLVVLAQGFQTGTIAGTATDQTGGSLPGVTVTVTNQERNTTRSEVTDSQGKYRFAALPLGRYTIEAALEGFEKTARSNVLVEAEKTSELNLQLGLAASTESITVTADAAMLQTASASVGQVIGENQISSLPMNGRTPLTLAQLSFGVTPSSDPRFTRPFDNAGPSGFSMGGGQAGRIGLKHLDTFSQVGIMSAGMAGGADTEPMATLAKNPAKANKQLDLLWIACGTEDTALKGASTLHHALDKVGIKHTYLETPGAHHWRVWRRYLRDLAPLLFK